MNIIPGAGELHPIQGKGQSISGNHAERGPSQGLVSVGFLPNPLPQPNHEPNMRDVLQKICRRSSGWSQSSKTGKTGETCSQEEPKET